MTYLDANATEPLRPEARAAMLAALDATGNPSSVHAPGRAARRILEDAREAVAARWGARPADVVFTSGGTEANALAIAALGAGRRIIIGATEHDAVRQAAPDATILPVDPQGRADLDALAGMLAEGGPSLICLMAANNETGVLHPLDQAAALCRRHGALLHVDAVQAAGRLPLDLPGSHAASFAISGHKLGGPAGAGALLLTPDAPPIAAILRGGGQERGRRGGTQALPAIAGLAAAAACPPPDTARIAALRDAAEHAAIAAGATVCGAGAPRLPNTTCLVLPGIRADAQVIALDLAGIAVSAGAACSSGKVAVSHVLAAMGLGPRAGHAIRVSLPWNVTPADIDRFAAAYPAIAARLAAHLGTDRAA